MTNAEILDKFSAIFPNFALDKATKDANVDYILNRLILDYLHVRERWVTNLAYYGYQTKQLTETISNKLALADDKDVASIVLGKLAHSKSCIPFFPQHSFKNGEQYDFTKRDRIVKDICKSNVKLKVNIENISNCDNSNENMLKAILNVEDRIKLLNDNREYVCDQNCISASENEVFRLKTCLEKCSNISYKAFRNVIEEFDICGNDTQDKAAYRLNKFPRNHPSECYLENSDCNSEFVLLRKVGVHSSNIRQFYDKINLVKKAHNFLSDLDTSLILKDIDYMIKLTRYIPVTKSKVLDNVSRKSCIVNENNVIGQYGDQYSDFLKKIKDLPKFTCISCEILIKTSEAKIITNRRKKLDNDSFTQLKQHLCSEQRASIGKEKVESILNKHLCSYCNTKLNNNETPRVSVINGFDAGKCPNEICMLNIFSSLFIKLASSFQTHLKLEPIHAKVPENQKMVGVRGNSVQLPIPIQNTIEELESNLSHNKLLDVGKHLVIYNEGKNKKVLYKNLINIHDIKSILIWLEINNPHYAHIEIPTDPEELLPCIEDTSICEVINEDSVIKETEHTIDSITEYITQDAYYDSEDEDMLLNDTYNCEVLTQDVYRNSGSELTIYNDIEINEMQTHGEYHECEYEEMITRDIHYDSQVNPEVHVVSNDVFFTQNDSDNETMLTQEQYTASTDGIFLTHNEFVACTN